MAGAVLYLAITAAHAWYLYGFLPVAGLIFPSLIGGILLYFGLKKLVSSVFASPLKVSSIITGLFVFGLGFLTLLPGWPDSLLLKTPIGWPLLEYRIGLLDQAMYEDNLSLVRKIAWAGVGDPEPRDSSGRPLLDDAKNPQMLKILLDSGLNPDVRGEGGTTLLMRTHDENMARVLLASGADPNARDENGRTPLMHVHNTNLELMKVLAENGAEVNAVDDVGRTVADWLGGSPGIENVLGQYARGGIRRSAQVGLLSHARRDWLAQKNVGNGSLLQPSAISVNPDPMEYGDQAELQIRLSNDSDTDRVIKVEATLETDVLFVDASHDGKIMNPYQAQQTQKIGWPLLALPARGSGVLTLNIITRDTWDAGELSVDVRARNVLNYAEEEPFFLHFQLPFPEPADAGFSAGNFLAALVIPLPIAILVVAWRYLGQTHPVTRGIGRLVAGLWSVGFALFVYSDATNLVRPYTFEKTGARILDRRYYVESTTSDSGAGGGASRSRRSTTTYYRVPIVAARYTTPSGEVVSAGSPGAYDFRELKLGAVVPCWYDPENPNTFVLTRGVSFFTIIWIGILSISSLVLAWVALRRRGLTRVRQP